MIKWLSGYNKFLVAISMAVIYYINSYYGIEIPLGEMEISAFWMVITSLLVYAVPNKGKEE